MKLNYFLRASLFVALMLGGISCSQTDVRDDKKKIAEDAVELIQEKFDHTKILVNNLSDQDVNADNIQKIIDITTCFIKTDIPRALSAVNKNKEHSRKILKIKKEILKTRKIAVKKAEDEAKNAALVAITEKQKAQRAQEELQNAKIDADFVQTNMPKTGAALVARDAAHAARLKTIAFCRILEKFPHEKSYAKSKTYVAQAESSAIEADKLAKIAHEKYQNVLHKNKNLARQAIILNAENATNKALIDAEAAELAVQEILINMSLILRLFTQDLKNIYTIANAIEKSVYAISLSHESIKNAEDLLNASACARVPSYENKFLASRNCLNKTHAAFESHVKSVGETLLKIIKDKFAEIKNSGTDPGQAKVAQAGLHVAIENLKISCNHMKIFEHSGVYNLKNAHDLIIANLKIAKKYGTRARKVQID